MTCYARVADNGEVVLPAELARLIGLKPGDQLSMDADGTNIILKTYADIVRDGQRAFRATITRPFTVEEFMTERRAQAASE